MFNDSIEANIKYGNQNASSIEIEKAAEEAGKKFTPNKRKDPLIWNAETKKYDIVADELSLESWSSREWIKRTYSLTDDQVDETIKAGDALINLYSEQRARLFAEGIISKEKTLSLKVKWDTIAPGLNIIHFHP